MKIEIIRMRRKTICLKLEDSDHAVLKVPMRVSEKEINKFLQSKQRWLEKNCSKLKNFESFERQFDFDKYIYIDGKIVMKVEELSMDFSEQSQDRKKKLIKKYYLSCFTQLEQMAKDISLKTGLKYNELKPTSSTRVWGSYSTKKTMKLNWKLVILPKELREYIICHELCHSLHMNHQPKFWKDVENICPDYKQRKKELNQYSFLLKNNL